MKTKWIETKLLREFESEKTDAHRLATAADGWVERFGDDVLISHRNDEARERLIAEFISWAEVLEWKRIFVRFLPREDSKRVAPDLFLGDAGADRRGIVTERALRYGVDFSAGYSPGLFLDQRENRSFVRRIAPKSMLNCFSYTGSFSVAAASADTRTLSIDLSRKSLERARENFVLNGLSTDGHRFIGDDAFEVLPRLARKGEKFDLIVLDPPTFSRSRNGRTFHVESNFEDLLLAALDVAERRARILLSTNCSRLNERSLEVMARFCLKATRRAGSFDREALPVEFPPGSASRTVWLTLH